MKEKDKISYNAWLSHLNYHLEKSINYTFDSVSYENLSNVIFFLKFIIKINKQYYNIGEKYFEPNLVEKFNKEIVEFKAGENFDTLELYHQITDEIHRKITQFKMKKKYFVNF